MNGLSAGGFTFYSTAFAAAFEYFGDIPYEEDTERDRVILFLTDGDPTETNKAEILSVITSANMYSTGGAPSGQRPVQVCVCVCVRCGCDTLGISWHLPPYSNTTLLQSGRAMSLYILF